MRLIRCTCDDQLEICDCELTVQLVCKNESFGDDRCEDILSCEVCN